MDNKLSELSKPVAWTDERGNLCTNRNKERGLESRYHQDYEKYTKPFYSQEYVSALLAELEASKKSNAFLKEQLAKLANFNPDWDMLEACRESWREVAAALKEAEARLAAKDKRIAELEYDLKCVIADNEDCERTIARKDAAIDTFITEYDDAQKIIAELEAIRSDASQVFKEIGNELGCNPDNESIMMAIDDLKATQMTGPLKDVLKRNIELEAKLATPVRLPSEHELRQVACSECAGNCLELVEGTVRAAGFTVEGDEQ
ncbi:TPA: hypothetical protein KEU09_003027 [Serratia marcescens]|nr:hypothetical protein [Serratia marcescens]